MGSPSLLGPLMATFPFTTRMRNPVTSPHHASRPAVVMPSPRAKQQLSPEWEAESEHPREPTPQRWREDNPLVGHLGDSCCEAFYKDSELVQCIRWTYFRTHALTFHKEDTYKLMEVFKELAEMAGLLGTEVYPVHDQWVGRKELCSAYHAVRGSAKDLHFFRTVASLESPKVIGLQGIHSPEALKQQAGLSFCPWCGKEGQNKGTIINHLCTGHYHLGLACERCLSYFAIRQNVASCPRVPVHALPQNNRDREVEKFNWACCTNLSVAVLCPMDKMQCPTMPCF